MKKKKEVLIVSGILFVLIFIFFWKAATLQEIFFVGDVRGNDTMEFAYPWKVFFCDSLKSKTLPLWTTDIYNGYPIHADGEGAFFYPINLILCLFLPAWAALNYNIILTFFFAGLFTYLYGRTIELSKTSAFLSAIIFMFSGFFVTHVIHLIMISVAMWIPLCLYLIEKYFKTNKVFYAILLGVAIAMQVLGGFPQMTYYSILMTITYFIFKYLNREDKQEIFNVKRHSLVLLMILTIGIGLSAIQWIPTLEFVRNSSRQEGISFEYAKQFAYRFKDLIMFIKPNFFGTPINATYNQPNSIYGENCAYIGIIPLVLAIMAIFICWKNRYVKFFTILILAIFSILLIEPFFKFLWLYFPGFKYFRMPHRLLIFVVLSLSVLSGICLDNFLKKKQTIFKNIIILLVIIDLFKFGIKYNPTINSDDWLSIPNTVEYLEKEKALYRIFSPNIYRYIFQYAKGWAGDINVYTAYRKLLYVNFNMVYKVSAFNGNGGIFIKRTKDILNTINEKYILQGERDFKVPLQGSQILGLQNVKYVISIINLTGQQFKLIKELDFYPNWTKIKIYENKYSIQRTSIVQRQEIIIDENKKLKYIHQDNFNPLKTVVLEENVNFGSNSTEDSGAKITKYENNEVIINTKNTNDGFLVLSDTYYSGWKCYVDGKEEKILRANYLFRAVPLLKGNHEVKFVFKPVSFKTGMCISISTLLIISVVIILLRKKQKVLRRGVYED